MAEFKDTNLYIYKDGKYYRQPSSSGTITINGIESDSFGIDSTIDTRIASNNSVFFSYHNVGVQVYNANDTSAFSEHTSSGMLSLNPIDLFDPTLIESLGTLGVADLFFVTGGTDISSIVTWSDFVQMVIMAGSIALVNPSTLQVTVLPLKEIEPNLNGNTSFYARYGNIDYNGNALEVCLLAVQSDNDIGDIQITINPANTVTEREGMVCIEVTNADPNDESVLYIYIQRGWLMRVLDGANMGLNIINLPTVFNSLTDEYKIQLLLKFAGFSQSMTLMANHDDLAINIGSLVFDTTDNKMKALYLELNDSDPSNYYPEVQSLPISTTGLGIEYIR